MQLPADVYDGLNAQYYAWGFSWDRLENPDDEFNWNYIDQAVDFTSRHDGKVVFLITPSSSWATGGEPQAPHDLDRDTPLSAEIPEYGFSEILYDYAYKIIERAARRDPDVLGYLRYGNEPQYPDHWNISEDSYQQDVEDFIRCLRTVYKAAHDAAAKNNAEINVSHGGFYYNDQLNRLWFNYGEEHPEAQDSILTLYNSRYERQWPKKITTWDNFRRLFRNTEGMPPTYWMDVMAGQTEWLDWFDIHYHFKPRFIFDDINAFEQAVLDSGGTLKPWLAAEAAMQIEASGNTEYEERFHAGDMVRKWVLGIAAGLEGICTPILGYPPDRFYGLYSERGKRYLAADSYEFLHSLIHPQNPPENMSRNRIMYFRLKEDEHYVDVLWLDTYSDSSEEMAGLVLPVPAEFLETEPYKLKLTVFDIQGNIIGEYNGKNIGELNFSQEPLILKWEVIDDLNPGYAKYEPDDGYIYHGVGWNYQNSIPNYLDMMPYDQQPLLFQTMSAIPGTRPLTVEKIQKGLKHDWMDPHKQYTEYGVHFHKTQDEPYDSLFAFTNEMDHYIDSLALAFKRHDEPFFLRIGGEFSGSWNNYTPYTFPKAFRKLVLELRSRDVNNFATVWCYEPVAEADFADSTRQGRKWYPGDDVVDWFGLDVFPLRDFDPDAPDTNRNGLSAKGKSELFLKFAEERGKPVYINETTAHSENIPPDSEDPGFEEGKKIWEHWFEPFFQFLENHPNIKAINYINLDWRSIEKWKQWGDCRLEINTYIKNKWIEELSNPKYIHKGYEIDRPLSVDHISIDDNISIYPNPVSTEINIVFNNKNENTKIEIYSMTGSIIFSRNLDNVSDDKIITFDMSAFSNGMYIAVISSGKEKTAKKIIKID